MTQPELPFQAHSATSQAAAKSMKGRKSDAMRQRVYAFLVERGAEGATDEEMQGWLDMNPSTQRPRRIELVATGQVVDSGKVRKTLSGRSATVWVAKT